MEVASGLKDVFMLGMEIKKSFEKMRANKKRVARLLHDIAQDLDELEAVNQGCSFKNSGELIRALNRVKSEMLSVHELCQKLMPTPSDKTSMLSLNKAKFKAWYKRDDIEDELAQLRDRIRDCLAKFTTFAVARIEGTALHVEHTLVVQGVESRVRTEQMNAMLQTYLLQTPQAVREMDDSLRRSSLDSILYGRRSVECQYLDLLLTRLVDSGRSLLLARSGSKSGQQQIMPEAPNELHVLPIKFTSGDGARRQPSQVDSVVMVILKALDYLRERSEQVTLQDLASVFRYISAELKHQLRYWLTVQCSGLDNTLSTMQALTVALYRSLAAREILFLPFLSLELLKDSSDSLMDPVELKEAYDLSITTWESLPETRSPALHFMITNKYVSRLIHNNRCSEALPIARDAVNLCFSLLELADSGFNDAFHISKAFHNLFMCFFRQGNLEEAKEVAEESIELLQTLPIPSSDSYRCDEVLQNASSPFIELSNHMRDAGSLESAYHEAIASIQKPLPLLAYYTGGKSSSPC
ncbi:hypothetical protein C8J56DRAFT_917375 [Mycena floridula]|nr:hypothetical protein C8J56DRAFT_917375 [Mycena floridula]